MSKKGTTYDDIARYTGFSKTTISRYFSKPDSVTPKNREIIAHALDVLDYQSNKLAQVLAKGHTEFIGLLIPNLYLNFFGEVLRRFLGSYEQYGYKFIVFDGNNKAESERKYINELISYNVEGLIVLSHTLSSFELSGCGVPVVAIEREDKYISSVNTDNYSGAVMATELLAGSGGDVMLHINRSGINHDIPAAGRIDGFTDVCEERGIPYEVLTYDAETDYTHLESQILGIVNTIEEKYPGKVKGIFTSSDAIANIVINELFRRKKDIPGEYRIIGFDGSPISAQAIIPFSTIAQQIDKLVGSAMELLVDQIETARDGAPPKEPEHLTIEPQLIDRATT